MINKYELNNMLNSIPVDKDTQITIKRSMGDTFTFFNYEKHKIQKHANVIPGGTDSYEKCNY